MPCKSDEYRVIFLIGGTSNEYVGSKYRRIDMELDRPGLKRIKELYDSGAYQKDIAEDPEIRRTVLAGIDNPVSRKWKVFHTINSMAEMGIIVKREPNNMKAPSIGPSV